MSKMRWDRAAIAERISRHGSERSDAGPPVSYRVHITREEKAPRGSNVCRACYLWHTNLEEHLTQSAACWALYVDGFVAEAKLRWSKFECHACGSPLTPGPGAATHLSTCSPFRVLLAKSVNVEAGGSRVVRDVVSCGFELLRKRRPKSSSKKKNRFAWRRAK